MKVNLQASRCPDATILMRRVLGQFESSDESKLVIASIEPSLQRNITGYIELMSLGMKITSESSEEITEEHHSNWEDDYDEEDYEDVTEIKTIIIEKVA